jgi:aspartyl-tRNA(Asn)/glutamyl-tRNA(Gln) amidotransferase subunit A
MGLTVTAVDDPSRLIISDAAALIASGDLKPSTLMRAVIERLGAVQPTYHPYATIMRERAVEEAERADAEIAVGQYRGPLHGIPIGVKDVMDVAGVPTRCGSEASGEAAALQDAGSVARLRQAGAIVLGKTVTHEYALGSTSPPSRCAWDVDAVPGGSSGGSAVAVALDVALAALGTDTGSSVRNPASLNGVVGVKPTYGRVGRGGTVPCSWSCDHVGLMTKTVEDAAFVLGLISGRDPRDPSSVDRPPPVWLAQPETEPDIRGLRLGIPLNFFFSNIRDDVRAPVEEAVEQFERLGAVLVPVPVPLVEYSFAVGTVLVTVECASLHRQRLRERGHLFSRPVRDYLSAGALLFGARYVDAQRVRRLISEGLRRAFEDNRLDALVTPTSPLGAVSVGREMVAVQDEEPAPVMSHYARLTCPFNLSGLPAMTVPCGFDSDRHPVGVQIVGRPFEEDTIMRVGYVYQQATTWHRERPSVAGTLLEPSAGKGENKR